MEIKEGRTLTHVTTPLLRPSNGKLQNNPSLDPHAKITVNGTNARVTFSPDINRQMEFACAGLGDTEYDGFAGQFVVLYELERDAQGGEVGGIFH